VRGAGFNHRKLFARNMRKHRLAIGISQEKLAELSGLHRTYVSDVERCQKNVSIDSIAKIAKGLNLRICQLFLELKGR
jgi:transcriptional regulator with XRE-family HTH domain